jgi:hypothetical protein
MGEITQLFGDDVRKPSALQSQRQTVHLPRYVADNPI